MNLSSESGRGLPHSKTQARARWFRGFREVLDCASPLALWLPLLRRFMATNWTGDQTISTGEFILLDRVVVIS